MRVMLILATNMPAALDMAVRSRVRVTMDFPLPNAEQCTEWWQRNACHLVPSSRVQSQNLNGVPPHPHHKKLGAMSVGLTFRGLNKGDPRGTQGGRKGTQGGRKGTQGHPSGPKGTQNLH